jgi:hypothetical protein
LWRGEGVEQRWYARGESCFSDHRPVAAFFFARLGGGDYDGAERAVGAGRRDDDDYDILLGNSDPTRKLSF